MKFVTEVVELVPDRRAPVMLVADSMSQLSCTKCLGFGHSNKNCYLE